MNKDVEVAKTGGGGATGARSGRQRGGAVRGNLTTTRSLRRLSNRLAAPSLLTRRTGENRTAFAARVASSDRAFARRNRRLGLG